MKKLLLFLAAAGALMAQPKLALSTNSPVYPGATIVVTVSLSGSAASSIGIFGFNLPAGASGLASAASNKFPYTGTVGTNGTNAILEGYDSADSTLNDSPYVDGPIATFNYTVPAGSGNGLITIALSNVLAASTTGTGVSVSASPLNSTVGVSPLCTAAITAATNAALVTLNQANLNLIGFDLNAALTGMACQ